MSQFIDLMITGAILSGGQSTRMRDEKGLLKLAGKPLVKRVADVLAEVVDELVVSVAPGMANRYAPVVEGAKIVEDPGPGIGPLQGIVTAMSAAKDGLILVVPCDTPFVKPAICSLVVSSVTGKDGAVPQVGPYFEPLHGCFDKTRCLRQFEESLASGIRKPVDAFETLEIAPVSEIELRKIDPELRSFWSLNSPEDLALAERLVAIHDT